MNLTRVRNAAVLFLSLGGLSLALAWAGLLVMLSQTDGLARYPGAERLGEAQLRLGTLPEGYISQSGVYQTPDDARVVLGWYMRQPGAGQAEPQSGMGSCLAWRAVEAHLFFQHRLAVTLCPQPAGTLILVNRSLAVRRRP